MKILAIDPGSESSGYVLAENYVLEEFGKIPNTALLDAVISAHYDVLAIEEITSYGMAVGKTIFDTVFWAGRYAQVAKDRKLAYVLLSRKRVKLHICQTLRANDSLIRRKMIDRFGVVGTKSAPGYFYGFKSDVWQAFALYVTLADLCAQTPVEAIQANITSFSSEVV